MGLTSTQADAFLNVFRGTTYTGFTSYVALFNGDPQGAGTEITSTITGAATRNAAGFGAPGAGTGDQRKIANSGEIEITASAAGSATADYFAIYDAATGGTLRFSGALTSSLAISAGSPVKFEAAALEVIIDPEV
jgi:hypothetical protein